MIIMQEHALYTHFYLINNSTASRNLHMLLTIELLVVEGVLVGEASSAGHSLPVLHPFCDDPSHAVSLTEIHSQLVSDSFCFNASASTPSQTRSTFWLHMFLTLLIISSSETLSSSNDLINFIRFII